MTMLKYMLLTHLLVMSVLIIQGKKNTVIKISVNLTREFFKYF